MNANTKSILPELITGLFVIAVVALLAFFTIVISGVDWLHGTKSTTRRVQFSDIAALKVQDPVYVRGLKVGSVQSLALGDGCVWVTLSLKGDLDLRADCSATIAKTSMLGGNCVELLQGVSPDPLPADATLKGEVPLDVMRELGELVSQLKHAVEGDTLKLTLNNIHKISNDFADISGRLQRGEGFLGKLLSPQDTTYADLQATVSNLKTLSEDLRDGKGLLGKLMREDDTSYADLCASLSNIKSITAKLNSPSSGLGRLLSEESPLIADLEATASNLKVVTAKLERGEGTFGKLLTDDAVARELEAALKDVRQLIDNLRDTAPITSFSSLFLNGL